MPDERETHPATHCAHAGEEPLQSASTPSVMPIYQTAVYDFPDLETVDDVWEGRKSGFIYGRFGLPNTVALERVVATLEKGEAAIAGASGMGSIVVALWTILQSGDEVVVANDSYGGTLSLAAKEFPRVGITSRFVATTSLDGIEAAFTPKTKALLVETLSNPLWNVIDVQQIADLCHRKGVKLIVDNTVATPYLVCPLTLGADLVVHSGTKFFGGHHDVTSGILVGSHEFVNRARDVAIRLGASLAPFDAWLTVRGIKTFSLRMERICGNALALARFLEQHPAAKRVYYPGLASHPQNAIVRRTMKGLGGGMLSFEMDPECGTVEGFVKNSKLIRFAPSLGGVTTTVSHPAKTSHRSLSPAQRSEAGISDSLLRLSVGIEDAFDLIADLEQSLQQY